MLSHQFGQDLVLALDLLFQVKNAFLFGLMIGAAFGLSRNCSEVNVRPGPNFRGVATA